MQLKQSMNLLLIALFLWAFQGTSTHFTDHTIDNVSECQVCEHTKYLDTQHHEAPISNFYTSTRTFTTQLEQHTIANAPVDLMQSITSKHVDFLGLKHLKVKTLPLGFDTTAPPSLFV
ncbi:hypothetical protein [Sulfurovum sp.]|uniref:hypothetical protein n=1 Tax=Sulfurovum sp. TaxID=1969726 RepID=UPI002868235D|nr:hypothetical protein [Sulfurovum sp.]